MLFDIHVRQKKMVVGQRENENKKKEKIEIVDAIELAIVCVFEKRCADSRGAIGVYAAFRDVNRRG